MITSSTRVSDALSQRPELRTILPAFHPAFARLNHPVLGRVLPKLVTVAEAARVAGVDPDVLVAVMNLPAGAPLPEARPGPAPTPQPAPDWVTADRVVPLDARPILAGGEDPLSAILAALRALPPGGQLAVTAPFEPVPLIGLLARQGWRAWSRWDGGDCTVVFGREDGATSVEEAPLAGSPPVRRGDGWEVDVRGLVPPEPMRRVLACLDAEQLPLRVVHEREPALLYPQLAQRGLAWRVSSADGAVYVDVRRP